MKSRLLGAASACVIALVSQAAQAVPVTGQGTWESTLEGRDLDGNAATFEAYYDTTLDITWLADANAAGPTMTWTEANNWVANLNVNGITGWRLPTNTPVNGSSYNYTRSNDGTTDFGFAATTTDGTDGGWRDGSGNPVSEMGHLFYVTLGNLGVCDPTLPVCTAQAGSGLTNTANFSNILSGYYWSGSERGSGLAWVFSFSGGSQGGADVQDSIEYAWAVRSGDVNAVPVPAAAWLFGSGLMGLLGLARRKR